MPSCQASLGCVPYSLPSPEASATQARDYIFQSVQFPRKCPSSSCSICIFHFVLHQKPPTKALLMFKSAPVELQGQKSTSLRPLWQVLEGDPILFPLPLPLARWLAPMQHGARWRGQGRAPELMNCKRDAARQPARSSSKRAVTCYHLVPV